MWKIRLPNHSIAVNKIFTKAYRLVEQGLAVKRVLLVVIPLIIFFVVEYVNYINEGDRYMVKTNKNAFNAKNVLLNCIITLSGNIAGGALLANGL